MPCLRTGSPSPTSSILMTSAPMSARNIEQNGPERILDRSTTRMPESCIGVLCRQRHAILRRIAQFQGKRLRASARGLDVATLHVTVAADRGGQARKLHRHREVVGPKLALDHRHRPFVVTD